MNKRLPHAAAVCLLVLAACGDPDQAPVEAPDAALLSYSLTTGDEFQYEVSLDQHIDLQATGDPAAMGGEDIPGEAAIDVAGTGTFSHTVSEGPEEGTYEIHITGEFSDVSVSGTVDGEPVDGEEIPDFASMEPIDTTVVVDEQGNVVSVDGEEVEDPMAGLFGGMGPMGGGSTPAPGLDPGGFFGPLFSDEEVTVGDSWSDEIETPGMGEDPIVTSVTTTITGVEDLDGTEVYVIDTATSTSIIEIDLGELFRGLFGAFAPEDDAEMDEMLEQLKFLMTIDDTTSSGTSRFDAEAGIVRQTDTTAGSHITMDMVIPDEATGELIAFQMDMTIDQDVAYHLISGPTA